MTCGPGQSAGYMAAPAAVHDWTELAELIGVCARLIRASWRQQPSGSPVSDVQFSLLWVCRLAPAEGLSQNELAAALAISPAHVSGHVEQLRQRGRLSCKRSASDRRRQLWQLTSTGREELEKLVADQTRWAEELGTLFDSGNRQSLNQLLRDLVQSLREPTATLPGPRLFTPDCSRQLMALPPGGKP